MRDNDQGRNMVADHSKRLAPASARAAAYGWKPAIAAVLTLLVCVSLLGGIVWAYQRDVEQREKVKLSTVLTEVASVVSLALATPMAAIEALSSTVQADPAFAVSNFDLIAASVAANVPAIISLQLAPGGVVRHVTDRARNQTVIGHDLFADPARAQLAQQARKKRKIMIEGPTRLLQGGWGLIIRNPIFLQSRVLNADGFWGFATAVIDSERLLQLAFSAVPPGVQVSLRGRDASGQDGEVF
jgi:sensor domain CHASE-containing protein